MIYVYDIIIILFSFGLFGLLHSWLASNKVKLFVAKQGIAFLAFYRFIYNIISLYLFVIIMYFIPRPSFPIYDLAYPYDIIILIPQMISLIFLLYSLKYFSLGEFAGVSQIIRWFKKEFKADEGDEKSVLRLDGLYKISRHPVYLFSMLFLLFRPAMDLFYLTMLFCFGLYFYIGSIYEERKLEEKYGETYTIYKSKVRRFI